MVKYNYLLTYLFMCFFARKANASNDYDTSRYSTGISSVIALQVSQYLLLKYPAKSAGQQNRTNLNMLDKRACIWKHLCV